MEDDEKAPQFVQELKNSNPADHFPKSLTDASYLLGLSKIPAVLPNFGGEKNVEPDQTSVTRTSEYYNNLSNILSEERVCRIGSLSLGRWEPTKKLIVVFKAVGSLWRRFGTNIGGVLYALPEEGLFLIEQGVFELYLNDLPLSVEESWALLLRDLPSLEYYTVFAFLCRLGFAVLSSRKQEYFPDGGLTFSRDTTVKESVKKQLDIIQRSSQEQLEEKPFSEAPPKLSIGSSHLNDSEPAKPLDKIERFFDEYRYNRNENTPSDAISMEMSSRNAEQSISKTNCGTSKVCMGSFDVPTVREEMDNMPLVLPQDAVSVDAVMRKLQIISGRAFGSSRCRITSDSATINAQFPLHKKVHSVGCIQNVESLDMNQRRNVKRTSANEMIESSYSPRKVYNRMGLNLESSREVPVSETAAQSISSELDLLPKAIPYSVEQGVATASQSSWNDGIFTEAPLLSLELSRQDMLYGNVEMDLAQNKMQGIRRSVSSEYCPDTMAVNDVPGQALSSATSLEATEIPAEVLTFFDVYYKTTAFKKSSPGLPDCRIFPCSYSQLPLDLKYMDSIFDCCANIPVRFGLCDQGSVTFYSIIKTNVSVML